jgi:hypothetical protein
LAVLLGVSMGRAEAQVSGATNGTTGSSCSQTNNTDRSCQFSVDAISATATTVASRYRWNISTDVGTLGNQTMNGTAQHNINFNVTVNGGYRIDLNQQRIGEMRRVDDCGTICVGDNGSASVSGVAGSQTGDTVSTGSLNLADPPDNPAKGAAIDINQSQAATIHAVSNGVSHAHSLSFVQTGSTNSSADETALRMGAGSTVSGCTICLNRSPDNDGHFVSLTVVPLCGNSVVDAAVSEQCDQGVLNGTAASCCTANCTFKTSGTQCRISAGDCDPAETCTGASATCPADAKSSAVCRASGGDCDLAESCDGVSNTCPPDAKSSSVCRASGGACDVTETCDGINNACPGDAKDSTTTCRASGGVCDPAEVCDGVNDACPNDAKSTSECRASGGVCDLAESCDGINNNCPADAKSTAVCRGAGGICDVAEVCDGVGNACPADTKVAGGTECRGVAGICDVAEQCDGVNNACPPDAFEPASTVCRASTVGEVCDIAEFCTGTGANCPADVVEPASTVCRASTIGEVCDIAEFCDGTNKTCPADVVEPATTVCRPTTVGEVCDVAEFCDGSNKTCPSDAVEPSSTVCRATTVGEECDAAENCDGSSKVCPSDAVLPNGTTCRASAGVCDVTDTCNGSSKVCPADAKSTAQCRGAAGVCDVAESCDGVGDNCPADGFVSDGTNCDDSAYCNGTQTCTAGVCGGGSSPCPMGQSCDESTDSCFVGDCPVNPVVCAAAQKNKLLIKNKTDNSKDKLVWKWTKGDATTQTQFGDPTTTAAYALCFYAGATPTLIEGLTVPPAGGKWSAISTKGYKYKDPGGTNAGVTKIIVKGGAQGKSKALVKGKGANLPDFDTDLPIAMGDLPMTVQLRNKSNGLCWGGSFASPKKNQLDQFNAKTPP